MKFERVIGMINDNNVGEPEFKADDFEGMKSKVFEYFQSKWRKEPIGSDDRSEDADTDWGN